MLTAKASRHADGQGKDGTAAENGTRPRIVGTVPAPSTPQGGFGAIPQAPSLHGSNARQSRIIPGDCIPYQSRGSRGKVRQAQQESRRSLSSSGKRRLGANSQTASPQQQCFVLTSSVAQQQSFSLHRNSRSESLSINAMRKMKEGGRSTTPIRQTEQNTAMVRQQSAPAPASARFRNRDGTPSRCLNSGCCTAATARLDPV